MNDVYKKAIANAFIKVCKDKGIKAITVTDVIEECGISRRTFYNHFNDKFDVMNYIYESNTVNFFNALGSGNADLYSTILKVLQVALKDKKYYMSVVSFQGQNSFKDFFYNQIVKFYSELIVSMHGKSTLTEDVISSIEFNCYAATDIFANWISEGMKAPPEKIAKQVSENMPELMKSLIQ